ncbi:MAG: hypothetical protein LBD37_02960 [Treponema sp.]|nr:hypothetical protein [Treponema sp.]
MPRRRGFEKNALALREEEPRFAGIVLSGGLHVLRDDDWGNTRTLAARVNQGSCLRQLLSAGASSGYR